MRTYTELLTLGTFEERFEYLKTSSTIGVETFGGDRYLNQIFYNSPEWKAFRRKIAIRDKGCDLAFPERPIFGDKAVVHHLNPISVDDVVGRSFVLFDPENVVLVSAATHRALHYGDESLLIRSKPIERAPNDTCPWR